METGKGGEYLGGEIMKRAQETNPKDEVLTKEEEGEVAQLVSEGNINPMEAKKQVLAKRKEQEENQG